MTPFCLSFTLPGQPRPLNEMIRANKYSRNNSNKKWYDVVNYAVYKRLPKYPLNKVHLKFVLFNARNFDYDGAVGSLKPIVDGLIYAKVIFNDSYLKTGPWDVTQKHCKKGLERIEITVTERPDK